MPLPWPPLTATLRQKSSPVRRCINDRFPSLADLRHTDLPRRYRAGAGPLLVPRSDANPGTVGTAFDYLVRFLIHPHPDITLAMAGARYGQSHGILGLTDGLQGLADQFGTDAPVIQSSPPHRAGSTPTSTTTIDPDLVARGCWTLALLTELYRAGPFADGSPLYSLAGTSVTAEGLLDLAPTDALHQLTQMRSIAEQALLPPLLARPGACVLGPDLSGPNGLSADADLVVGGLLLEIKTGLGMQRKDGTRYAALNADTLRQLIGYVLLDHTDDLAITDVGVYMARYGYLATWNLRELLIDLAEEPVDIAAERATFRKVLRAGENARKPRWKPRHATEADSSPHQPPRIPRPRYEWEVVGEALCFHRTTVGGRWHLSIAENLGNDLASDEIPNADRFPSCGVLNELDPNGDVLTLTVGQHHADIDRSVCRRCLWYTSPDMRTGRSGALAVDITVRQPARPGGSWHITYRDAQYKSSSVGRDDELLCGCTAALQEQGAVRQFKAGTPTKKTDRLNICGNCITSASKT